MLESPTINDSFAGFDADDFQPDTPEYSTQVHRLKPVSACFIAWWP
jgi:hypothetical protein